MPDELSCPYRTESPVGTIYCACQGGNRKVYGCGHPTLGGYAMLHASRIRSRRIELFSGVKHPIPSLKLPVCATCPHRPEASQELKDLFLHTEPPPNPSPPVRSESLQNALVAICSNCPRVDAEGRHVTCSGPESVSCPQSLWPSLGPAKKSTRSRRSRSCCH